VSEVLVRPRTRADLPALVEVLAAQRHVSRYPLRWPLPFPTEEFVWREADLAGWVAEVDGRVVGHVAVQAVDDVFSPGTLAQEWSAGHGRPVTELGIMGTLFVDPAARGRGVGRVLHDASVGWLREHGLAPCLDVVPVHAAALVMYERLGWTEVARVRPPWLPDEEPDVVAMVLLS
jgi:GNAT superfamily N-acetyltransferase